MALILLRHTQPDIAEGICYGQSDLPLASDFEAQLQRLYETLPGFSRLYTSPLQRCHILAAHLSSARGIPVFVDPRLMEMNFGNWENQAWNDISRPELDAWADDFHHARPHGGESVADLSTRVSSFLADLPDLSEDTLIVCHAGIIRALLAEIDAENAWQYRLNFGDWISLDEHELSALR